MLDQNQTGLLVLFALAATFGCSKDTAVDSGDAVCAAGQYSCKGDVLRICNDSRSGWDVITTCAPGACVQGASTCGDADGGGGGGGQAGSAGASGSAGTAAGGTTGTQDGGAGTSGSSADAGCADAGESCVPDNECKSGKIACVGGAADCVETGDQPAGEPCDGGVCNGSGTCGVCVPGAEECVGQTPRVCEDTGQWSAQATCNGTTSTCALGRCLPIAQLVSVPNGEGGTYGIDETEVTRGQYEAWIDASPSLAGQVPECSWNATFDPDPTCMSGTDVCASNCSEHPIVCVDWCDAYAYCQAVGKRLCGKIGGGMNGWGDFANAATSQWFASCSSGGVNDYPYGDTYSGSTCNGSDSGHGTTVPVASMGGCQSSVGGYAGVYDLSGNVWEWEDSCNGNAGQIDYCRLRGGCFFNGGGISLRCVSGSGGDFGRVVQSGDVGFRCCSDP